MKVDPLKVFSGSSESFKNSKENEKKNAQKPDVIWSLYSADRLNTGTCRKVEENPVKHL